MFKEQNHCFFCVNNIKEIDYKNVETLKKFISPYGEIVPRKKSGVCTKHQKKLARAIKRARIMALLPFIKK